MNLIVDNEMRTDFYHKSVDQFFIIILCVSNLLIIKLLAALNIKELYLEG